MSAEAGAVVGRFRGTSRVLVVRPLSRLTPTAPLKRGAESGGGRWCKGGGGTPPLQVLLQRSRKSHPRGVETPPPTKRSAAWVRMSTEPRAKIGRSGGHRHTVGSLCPCRIRYTAMGLRKRSQRTKRFSFRGRGDAFFLQEQKKAPPKGGATTQVVASGDARAGMEPRPYNTVFNGQGYPAPRRLAVRCD